MWALPHFSKSDYFFLGKALLDFVSFIGLIPEKHEPLWMITLNDNRKKLNWNQKNNQAQLSLNCIHLDGCIHVQWKSYLLPFEPKISHLSNLYTIPPLSIVYYLLCCYRNGIEWHCCPKWLLSLNVASTGTRALLMTTIPLQTRPCAFTVALIQHSTETPTHTPQLCYTQTNTHWHQMTDIKAHYIYCVMCTFCEDNL